MIFPPLIVRERPTDIGRVSTSIIRCCNRGDDLEMIRLRVAGWKREVSLKLIEGRIDDNQIN